jgi:hypothetical protein
LTADHHQPRPPLKVADVTPDRTARGKDRRRRDRLFFAALGALAAVLLVLTAAAVTVAQVDSYDPCPDCQRRARLTLEGKR